MIRGIEFTDSSNLLVFDDGGMPRINVDKSGFEIGFAVYERILKLAKTKEISIPIACTAVYFDIDSIYTDKFLNPHIDKIIRYFDENKNFIKLWNHGLTHTFKHEYTEFYSYRFGTVDEKIQDEHIKLSQKIFNNLGFYSDTFVPPGHAWQQYLTDKIAKRYGIRNIAIKEIEKKSCSELLKEPKGFYKGKFMRSDTLNSLFRLGLGISYNKTNFTRKNFIKAWHYIYNIYPFTILINRRLKPQYPIDHFFAHIQNLQDPKSLLFFDKIIQWIKDLPVRRNYI